MSALLSVVAELENILRASLNDGPCETDAGQSSGSDPTSNDVQCDITQPEAGNSDTVPQDQERVDASTKQDTTSVNVPDTSKDVIQLPPGIGDSKNEDDKLKGKVLENGETIAIQEASCIQPAKRPRGRPRKPKEQPIHTPVKRPRGRPRKHVTENKPPSEVLLNDQGHVRNASDTIYDKLSGLHNYESLDGETVHVHNEETVENAYVKQHSNSHKSNKQSRESWGKIKVNPSTEMDPTTNIQPIECKQSSEDRHSEEVNVMTDVTTPSAASWKTNTNGSSSHLVQCSSTQLQACDKNKVYVLVEHSAVSSRQDMSKVSLPDTSVDVIVLPPGLNDSHNKEDKLEDRVLEKGETLPDVQEASCIQPAKRPRGRPRKPKEQPVHCTVKRPRGRPKKPFPANKPPSPVSINNQDGVCIADAKQGRLSGLSNNESHAQENVNNEETVGSDQQTSCESIKQSRDHRGRWMKGSVKPCMKMSPSTNSKQPKCTKFTEEISEVSYVNTQKPEIGEETTEQKNPSSNSPPWTSTRPVSNSSLIVISKVRSLCTPASNDACPVKKDHLQTSEFPIGKLRKMQLVLSPVKSSQCVQSSSPSDQYKQTVSKNPTPEESTANPSVLPVLDVSSSKDEPHLKQPLKRKRGRPRKIRDSEPGGVPVVKRPRGRPRKQIPNSTVESSGRENQTCSIKSKSPSNHVTWSSERNTKNVLTIRKVVNESVPSSDQQSPETLNHNKLTSRQKIIPVICSSESELHYQTNDLATLSSQQRPLFAGKFEGVHHESSNFGEEKRCGKQYDVIGTGNHTCRRNSRKVPTIRLQKIPKGMMSGTLRLDACKKFKGSIDVVPKRSRAQMRVFSPSQRTLSNKVVQLNLSRPDMSCNNKIVENIKRKVGRPRKQPQTLPCSRVVNLNLSIPHATLISGPYTENVHSKHSVEVPAKNKRGRKKQVGLGLVPTAQYSKHLQNKGNPSLQNRQRVKPKVSGSRMKFSINVASLTRAKQKPYQRKGLGTFPRGSVKGRHRSASDIAIQMNTLSTVLTPKRKRGRPRKNEQRSEPKPVSKCLDNVATPVVIKRKRGRPRKIVTGDVNKTSLLATVKRKRGRPRKNPVEIGLMKQNDRPPKYPSVPLPITDSVMYEALALHPQDTIYSDLNLHVPLQEELTTPEIGASEVPFHMATHRSVEHMFNLIPNLSREFGGTPVEENGGEEFPPSQHMHETCDGSPIDAEAFMPEAQSTGEAENTVSYVTEVHMDCSSPEYGIDKWQGVSDSIPDESQVTSQELCPDYKDPGDTITNLEVVRPLNAANLLTSLELSVSSSIL